MSKVALSALALALALTAVFAAFFYWKSGGVSRPPEIPRLKPEVPKLEARPEKFEFTVCVGEEVRGEVRVENVGKGKAHVFARLRRHKGTVTPSSFVLGAGGWRNVSFSMRVPKPGLFNGSLALILEGGVVEIPIVVNATECHAAGSTPPPASPSGEEFEVVLSIAVNAEAEEEGRKAVRDGEEHCISSLAASEEVDLHLKLRKAGADTYRATGKVVVRKCRIAYGSLYITYLRGSMISRQEVNALGENEKKYVYDVYLVLKTWSDGTISGVDFLVNDQPAKDLAYPAGGVKAEVSMCARGASGFVCANRTLTNFTICVSYLDIKYALEKLNVNPLKEGVYTGFFDVTVTGPEGIASTMYACKTAAKCPLHLVSSITIHFTARVEVKKP